MAPFVFWLLEDQGVEHSEVARVIEKPWAYEDWLAIYRCGGSLSDLDAAAASK